MRVRFILIVTMFCAIPMLAQNMRSVFISMPDSITPLLTKVNKEDCVDFLASDMKAEVKNRFDGTAEMKVLTDDYTFVQTSEIGALEIKLLPINDSTKVICMVTTVCASACDSDIRFYASDWSKELNVEDHLQIPMADAFYLMPDSLSEEEVLIRKKADMHLMKASLSKDDTSLTFIYTTPDYLNKEDKDKLMLQLRKEAIVLRWIDGKFR